MPTRIDIIHRVIRTVRIQMQGIRVILTTPVRILRQKYSKQIDKAILFVLMCTTKAKEVNQN